MTETDSCLFSDTKKAWQFWVDRGGTFTDIVAVAPDGTQHTRKLLSENPQAYDDAALHGIRGFLGLADEAQIPLLRVSCVKMGTTVATNALLERKGERTLLAITEGLQDLIEIGHQARPKTFALNIEKPSLLYDGVAGITERVRADGTVRVVLDEVSTKARLQSAFDAGFRTLAIVLMHAYAHPAHEQQVARWARSIGFTQISVSHEVSPLSKIVPRGETTIVDAYLTPVLRRYIDRIEAALGGEAGNRAPGQLLFMQSSGGLTDASDFRGRDAILSGPAGGIVGCVHTAKLAGFEKVIGFDMGGTSTDVCHYAGRFEKAYETEVAGVRMRVPMMNIHTVAAGGGSLLRFDGERLRVGPESAGAYPGPVCYRHGGALAVTDINACLGKIQPDFFPAIFGAEQNMPLDTEASRMGFETLAQDMNDGRSAEQVAEGFLDIAIEHMAQAIKKISVARGHDVKPYVLNCFGGAGGQHACLVAERLGMSTVLIHPMSGVLSAYGMGLANISTERQHVFERDMDDAQAMADARTALSQLEADNATHLLGQGVLPEDVRHTCWAHVRYAGTDTRLTVPFADMAAMRAAFADEHLRQFGFLAEGKALMLETLGVTSHGEHALPQEPLWPSSDEAPKPETIRPVFSHGQWHDTPFYRLEQLQAGQVFEGPAVIIEPNGTLVVEAGWQATLNRHRHVVLTHTAHQMQHSIDTAQSDPVYLEVFNHLFMSIAEQMGFVLRNTSQSVNIKERLDFSCAVFDQHGRLVANAPHVPVHLGSMDASVQVMIERADVIQPGDVFVHNDPYSGGSHLPDITVITPVFDDEGSAVLFYVASRAHHEDVGGIAPGSMSPNATTIAEEGVVLRCLKLVDQGVFQDAAIRAALGAKPYPARNINQNIADLMAQVAANNTGVNELRALVEVYGLPTVHAYMGFIQDSAEAAVKRVLTDLEGGQFVHEVDSGAKICLDVRVDQAKQTAVIDFTGTSPQLANNFNAPTAISRAAVLYVFRCLIDDDIPLNAGCMKPLRLVIPEGCLLNPIHPAAVVAGNVETSQAVTNALFAALGVLGSSQGTMNNLTFGHATKQYYETICSGSPAGFGFDGKPAVHTHMTNTRLTDPEILELRYPVMLQVFSIRRGSGGRGRWCAGDGIERRIAFLEPMELSILSDHRRVPPFGLHGGEAGQVGGNYLFRASTGISEDLGGCAQTTVSEGDMVIIRSPTGGGFGLLAERNTHLTTMES